MIFSPEEVIAVLQRHGVTLLYHANTVTTSCSLLRSGALLSRADAIAAGLLQTTQYTDELDQQLEIFSDVFVDTVDIHARVKSHNNYGPVLFGFPLTLLASSAGPGIPVTRSNPANWTAATPPEEERWFCDLDSLNRDFTVGDFAQIIVIRTPGPVATARSTFGSNYPRRSANQCRRSEFLRDCSDCSETSCSDWRREKRADRKARL